MKYIIYNPFPQNHIFFIECLKLFYLEQCHHVEEIQKIDSFESNDDIFYFILINHMYLIENKDIHEDLMSLIKKKNKILYITEPLELIIEKQYYQKLVQRLKPQKIYTYCEENKNKIKTFVPIEYFYPINQEYLTFSTKQKKQKNKDKIVFIGKMNDYRNQLFDILGDDLIVFEDNYTKDDWLEIVNKYYYFVNVHRRPNSKCFESFRLLPLLQNDVVILSEHVNKIEEEKYKKVHFCKINEMKRLFLCIKNNSR